MNVYFFLGHTFFEQTIGIARVIQKKQPGSKFSAVFGPRSDLKANINKIKDVNLASCDWLGDLEQKWIDTPVDKEKLNKYKDLLGSEILRKIIIADREVGYGFVSSGLMERTPLIASTIGNDEAIWRYVIGLVDYLYTTYKREKIDAVFTYCVAGSVAFAMAEVARAMGIKFIQPAISRVKNYYVMEEEVWYKFDKVKSEFEKISQDPSHAGEYLKEAEEYLNDFRDKPISPNDTVAWIENMKKNSNFVGISKAISITIAKVVAGRLGLVGTKNVMRQRKSFDFILNDTRALLAIKKVINNKYKHFRNQPPSTPYIYFPLHVSPEASTMVFSPMFTDQIAVIEAIAKSMPVGMKLVIKEHLPSVGRRPKGFYERIESMPDVVMVSPFENNFALIKKADLIATITGTAAWEGMMLGKPALIFGNVHYYNVGQGFVKSTDFTKLAGDIEEALNLKPVDKQIMINYIAAIMKEGVNFSSDNMWFGTSTNKELRSKIINGIADKIIEICESKTIYAS